MSLEPDPFTSAAKKTAFRLGIPFEKFHKNALFYVFLQVVILAKVLVFFAFIGRGQTGALQWSPHLFINPVAFVQAFFSFTAIERFDLLFHQSMHVLIAASVFVFAKQAKQNNMAELFKVFFAASVLHNAGYWLTGVFSSPWILLLDFFGDIAALFFFYFVFRFLCKLKPVSSFRIPFVETAE
ncbi:MAG: hypothetical protein HY392_00605 [Candidatus Diapherotrites archaeon]|nr:hypothetical protein [Candidatus Diapherotrites archaeon]